MKENKTEISSLCWKCYNSVPNIDGSRGCSWSINHKPVEGWEAVPVTTDCGNTFRVITCPKYNEEFSDDRTPICQQREVFELDTIGRRAYFALEGLVKKRGISQTALLRELGMEKVPLSRWKRTAIPSALNIAVLANAGCDAHWILTGEVRK